MKKNFLSESDFIALVQAIKGCKFASIEYTTDVTATNKKLIGGKKNPYNGHLSYTTYMGVQIGASYENAVNNRLPKEEKGEFEAEALPWGEWIRPNYLIGHKGATYLRAYKYRNGMTDRTYFLDGKKVTDEKIIANILENIRDNATSARQQSYGIAEEEQVKPFAVNIANIEGITIDKESYRINHRA